MTPGMAPWFGLSYLSILCFLFFYPGKTESLLYVHLLRRGTGLPHSLSDVPEGEAREAAFEVILFARELAFASSVGLLGILLLLEAPWIEGQGAFLVCIIILTGEAVLLNEILGLYSPRPGKKALIVIAGISLLVNVPLSCFLIRAFRGGGVSFFLNVLHFSFLMNLAFFLSNNSWVRWLFPSSVALLEECYSDEPPREEWV